MVTVAAVAAGSERARAFIAALGGAANLKSVDACTTRLRLQVASNDKVSEAALKALGSRGLIKPAAGSVQVVLGPEADLIADEIRVALGAAETAAAVQTSEAAPARALGEVVGIDRERWLTALGGADNVRKVEAVAGSRLRVEVADAALVDQAALQQLGVSGVTAFSGTLLHIVLNSDAGDYAAVLQG
ncbi:PTS transporter subunit EIIB [Chromobacterium haemolyticum]|nr:PTS transporter subunit EIIB [Chromobacterium haemolyticum]